MSTRDDEAANELYLAHGPDMTMGVGFDEGSVGIGQPGVYLLILNLVHYDLAIGIEALFESHLHRWGNV